MTIEDSENQEENLSESDDTDDDMSISVRFDKSVKIFKKSKWMKLMRLRH